MTLAPTIHEPVVASLQGPRGQSLEAVRSQAEPGTEPSAVPHKYLTGDNSMCDADGYFWVFGRVFDYRDDDVLNVSGHRLSTTEIESALVSHPSVAEAAAVPRPDEIKGEAICVFVTLKTGEPSEELKQELRKHVRTQNRRPRHARRHPLRRRAPQNEKRQNHAALVEGYCQRQGGDHAGHDDAGRLYGAGKAEGG